MKDTRMLLALIISPALAITGYRFDKTWRWADTGYKAWTYRILSTISANAYADRLAHHSED